MDGVDEVFLASALLSSHATQDPRYAPTLASLEARPGFAGDAALLRLGAALMEKRAADIEPLLARVVELLAHDAWPNVRVAQDVLGTLLEKAPPVARWIDLAKTPFAGDVFHEQKIVAAINGERALAAGAQGAYRAECVATFGMAEPHPLWSRTILEARVACYEQHAAPLLERARADLARFVANE
jgi:hypothetical protein